MTEKKYAVIALFAATLGWGASFFLIKKATLEVGTWPFLFWRLGLASFVVAFLFPKKVLQVTNVTRGRGAVLGSLLWAAVATQTLGLQLTSASRSGFLTALYVPLTPLMAWALLKQKMNLRQGAIALIAVAGLYIMTSSNWSRNANGGDLWTLLTAVVSALHLVLAEKFSRKETDSMALGMWQIFGAFACTAVVTFIRGPTILWNISLWSPFTIFATVFAALIATCFGFITQIFAQKSVGSFKAALIFALEAPFASAFAYVLGGEVMTLQESLGAVLVFVSSVCPERWLKTPTAQTEEETHGPL